MRASAATFRSALAEARANPRALATQGVMMMTNDLVWVVFWLLFFDRVGTLRGWDAERILVLQAVLTTAGGLVLGLLTNARRIGDLATDGGLDAVLSFPVAPLAHLLVRRVEPVNLGDIVFGIGLFALAGSPTPGRVALYVAGVVAAAAVLTGFLVATGSLAFFTGRSEPGNVSVHGILMLVGYPAEVFTGAPRLVLYTVVPAAFVGSVPATLVDAPEPTTALALGGAAVVSLAVGWATFTLGLRRYTSGAAWTRA